jgi:hypothetical protein
MPHSHLYAIYPFSRKCRLWIDRNINGHKHGEVRRGGVVIEHEYIERELLDEIENAGFEEGEDFEILPLW